MKKLFSFIASVIGVSGCCNSPFLPYTPIHQGRYCGFKKISNTSPTPINVLSWCMAKEGTDYRIDVAKSVLLHGMSKGSKDTQLEYAQSYLEIYRKLIDGYFGKSLARYGSGDHGERTHPQSKERITTTRLAANYYQQIVYKQMGIASSEEPKFPYEWLFAEMRKIRRFSYREVWGDRTDNYNQADFW